MDMSEPPWNVLIVSAGGFGRSMLCTADSDPDNGKLWSVTGFLDDRAHLAATAPRPVVGDPFTYVPRPNDRFLCALGDPKMRRKYSEPLLEKGAWFLNLNTGLRGATGISMGWGCMFDLHVQMGVDTCLGDSVIVQSTVVIGYQVKIGSYVTINSFVFIGGGAEIGDDVVINPHATILPGVKIGKGAVIGAGSVVMKDVPPGVTMIGNPAKIFRFK
jgi:sugar O-acyltransferase (sialic acid O-acetyltransferase NeuD family)